MMAKESKWRESPRIIWAITVKDVIEAIKNKNTLTVIITSVLMLLVYRWLPVMESRNEPTVLLVYDAGDSALVAFLENSPAVKIYDYPSEEKMKEDLANGTVPELGLVIPSDFDRTVEAGGAPDLQGYVTNWVPEGDSAELKSAIESEISSLVGVPIQIQIQSDPVYPEPDSGGMGVNAGFGFIFLITMIGLSMVPHLMLEEKQTRTIDALLVSPAREWQVVAAKALTGLIYCALVSAVAWVIFYTSIVHGGLTLATLICGSLFTISIGLLLGTLIENRGQLTLLAWIFIIPLLLPVFLSLLDELVPDLLVKIFRGIPTVVVFNLLRASFAGEFPLVQSVLQMIWVLALAGGVLWAVSWLVRRRDRDTGGVSPIQHLSAGQISPGNRRTDNVLSKLFNVGALKRPSAEAAASAQAETPARVDSDSVRRRGSNQRLRIILAIASKDISAAIKNKIVLSIIVGTLLVVANGSLLPLLLSLRGTPTAVVYDEGRSSIVRALTAQEEFRVRLVDSQEDMEEAVSGAPDARLGLVIPADFDQQSGSSQTIELQGYFAHWADSDQVDRMVSFFEEQLGLAVWGRVRIETAGNTLYPTMEAVGQPSITSLMIFIVILTTGMALVPLLFLEEREAHTMDALLVSPANLRQIVTGKALAGAFYCLVGAGVAVLINNHLIVHWGAVLLAVVLGIAFSVAVGLVIGLLGKNQAATGLWGGVLITTLIGLTFVESFDFADWPGLVQKILEWQPGSTTLRLFQISMSGETPSVLLWTNAAALMIAALIVYTLVLGLLRRTDR